MTETDSPGDARCPACRRPESEHDHSLPGDPDGPMLICPNVIRVRDLWHHAECAIFKGEASCDCGAVVDAVLEARDA